MEPRILSSLFPVPKVQSVLLLILVCNELSSPSMNKPCSNCSLTLPISMFYTHTTIFDKHVEHFAECKTCTRKLRKSSYARARAEFWDAEWKRRSEAAAIAKAERLNRPKVVLPLVEMKRCHTCYAWLQKGAFFQWQGEFRKRTSRDCRACMAKRTDTLTVKQMAKINLSIEPAAPSGLTVEQKAARYAAVKAWRGRNKEKSRILEGMYKRMKRHPYYLTSWPLIVAHYGGHCVRCRGDALISDHVMPLHVEHEERNCLANLQPLCRACNSSKVSLSHDYRPDHGLWIRQTFKDSFFPFMSTGNLLKYLDARKPILGHS